LIAWIWLAALSFTASGLAHAASGSWMATLPRQTLAASERPLESAAIAAPAHVDAGVITRVHWSFTVSAPNSPLEAWLCQGSLCVALSSTQGKTERFQGRSATQAFRFRFRRPATAASGTTVVSHGRLIVDYEH